MTKQHKDKLPEEEAKRRRLESAKRYRDKNKEKLAAWHKKDRAENPEKYRERSAQYRANNAEQIKEYGAKYIKENRSEMARRSREWRSKDPERASEVSRRGCQSRRARKAACGGVLSKGLADKLMVLQKRKCAACQCDLSKSGFHIDHIIPLSKNGQNIDKNIQLLCPECNLSKHAKHPIEFMQSRGFLL